jgi:hypothetical protein
MASASRSRSVSDRRGVALLAALLATGATRGAEASEPPDKGACARSYEQAQRHRRAHELKAAKAELLVCSQSECPAWVRRDCTPWLGEVEAAMPSVVVAPRNVDGSSRDDVRVTIDGDDVAVPAHGEPLALDPGEHVLVFRAPGAKDVTQRVTLEQGERDRRIEVTLVPVPVEPPEPPKPQPLPLPAPPLERPVPALTYAFGGFGIAAAAVGGVFQVAGMQKRSDLFACRPACAEDQVDTAQRTLWAGNVLLGVAVVSVAAAAWFYFTRPSVPAGGASDHGQAL